VSHRLGEQRMRPPCVGLAVIEAHGSSCCFATASAGISHNGAAWRSGRSACTAGQKGVCDEVRWQRRRQRRMLHGCAR
jgi:hypothetical protein